MLSLTTAISTLSPVAKKIAPALERLGLKTVEDLLFYFPHRYQDFRQVVPIKNLEEGAAVTVKARVESINNRRSFRTRRSVTEALVSDESGSLRLVWFNQPYLAKILQPGKEFLFAGTPKRDMLGAQIINPIFERVHEGPTAHTARLVPLYPLTSGVTQKQLRFVMQQATSAANQIHDWLPSEVIKERNLWPLMFAAQKIHFPGSDDELFKSLRRLKFDEWFIIQLKAELARRELAIAKAPAITFHEEAVKKFVGSLPFKLTAAQKVAAWDIIKDTREPHPMNRLLSGDVGSGKTVVAALATYNAILDKFQAAWMAPTEILAHQHYASLCKLLGDSVKIGILTNSECEINSIRLNYKSKAKLRKAFYEKIESGELQVVVGTHALLVDEVIFNKLGLVVVDEQHRFGVSQRQVIKKKGSGVHFLSMTATPIPRSLALVLFGDLALSTIDELPPGRKRTMTRLVPPTKRTAAYQFIREQITHGRQAFVVCPLITGGDEGEDMLGSDVGAIHELPLQAGAEKRSVESEYKKLSTKIFPDLRIGFLHGKMKPAVKQETMDKFKSGALDILVSTSVVEVGVDVPNASVMMIEGADHFGLAQLHQFRGRVGRAQHQSYCLLFTENTNEKTLERLELFERENSGFKLAEKDLSWRGPGEVYGTEQSGALRLKLARITDTEVLAEARATARELVPRLLDYPAIIKKLSQWESIVHLE
jgi:ATP-dependent DNA helicase RecG